MQTRPAPGPGWYADPWQRHIPGALRYWDGERWTAESSTLGPALPAAPAVPTVEIHGGWLTLLGFVGANTLGLLAALTVGAFGVPLRSTGAQVAGFLGLWSGFALTAYVVTHRREGGSLADLGFTWPTGREIGLGFGMGVLALVAASRVALFLRDLLPREDTSLRGSLFLSPPSVGAIVVLAAAACIGAPIFEELFFRGIVQSVLQSNLGAGAAIVVQAALFGCAHYQLGMTADEALIRILSIATVGLFLGFVRNRTGRLGAGMAAHGMYNLLVVIATIALVRGA
jgi:membrane protease YdiL (CAAX protease family)